LQFLWNYTVKKRQALVQQESFGILIILINNYKRYGDIELPEGKKKFVIHIRRERNPLIRQMANQQFLIKK
jgi:predicted HNH restriction endonuclease